MAWIIEIQGDLIDEDLILKKFDRFLFDTKGEMNRYIRDMKRIYESCEFKILGTFSELTKKGELKWEP